MQDTPIERTSIEHMTNDEIDEMLLRIRDRRLKLAKAYEEAIAIQDAQLEEDQREVLEKALSSIKKDVDRIDKYLDKLDAKVNKIRALRLELEP